MKKKVWRRRYSMLRIEQGNASSEVEGLEHDFEIVLCYIMV
jgi:hypothetical protein